MCIYCAYKNAYIAYKMCVLARDLTDSGVMCYNTHRSFETSMVPERVFFRNRMT